MTTENDLARFDKRIVGRLLQQAKMSHKDYEEYLGRLSDCSDKISDSADELAEPEETPAAPPPEEGGSISAEGDKAAGGEAEEGKAEEAG